MNLKSFRDLLIEELRDTYDGEQQLVHALPLMADAAILPGRDGHLLLPPDQRQANSPGALAEMVRRALAEALAVYAAQGVKPAVAFLRDGPYGIPVRRVGKDG